MVPVKIECDCGQRYSFEVEPVGGRMPASVNCPSCGADGTTAANEFISTQVAPAAVVEPNPQPIQLSRQVATSPDAARETGSGRGLVNRPQAERQAKLKTMGGESQEQVTGYLLVQGFNRAEAMELAYKLFTERMATVRSNGIKKIIVGAVLTCVPFIAYVVYKTVGVFLVKTSIVVGCTGLYMCISGILMVVSPKSEKGNVVKE